MGRISILWCALWWSLSGLAHTCSDLVEAYDLLPEKAVLIHQATSEDDEICGPACLVNFAELVATARNLPAPDKTAVLDGLLAYFDGKNIDARHGLHFEQVLELLERESWLPEDHRNILPSGTELDAFGSAFHLRGRMAGAALTIASDDVLPKNGEKLFAALVQIQVYLKSETPGLHASRYSHFMLLVGKRNGKFLFLDPKNPKNLREARIGKSEKTNSAGKALTLHFQDGEFGKDKKALLTGFFRLKITP